MEANNVRASLVFKLTCERAFTVDLHSKTDVAEPADRHQANITANLWHRKSVGHDGVAVNITGEDLQRNRKINPFLNNYVSNDSAVNCSQTKKNLI